MEALDILFSKSQHKIFGVACSLLFNIDSDQILLLYYKNPTVRNSISSKNPKTKRHFSKTKRQLSFEKSKKSFANNLNESKNFKEINNIIIGNNTHINNIERSYSGNFVPSIPVNNPKFSRIKWNRGMILTHEGIYDSIFMLDSGSDPNVIGSNILDKLNLTPTKSNSSLSIVSGGKMTQVDTYISITNTSI
ncbi:hypothetical protein H8356DRAFT_1435662 [Neocallimastix lanati (nom. inval.)]|nr:hypothetical protein H8356DRAFT_1435662 [Neocallimastix sp. JGI-2020a]